MFNIGTHHVLRLHQHVERLLELDRNNQMSNSEICKMEITRIKRDCYLHTDRQKNRIGQGPWK